MGVLGFDEYFEIQIASSGFSLATIKTGKIINAEDRNFAMAA